MTEKFQQDFPNSHYLSNLSNLNLTNNNVQLGRLPTLGEILSNKTKAPVNLHTFYEYMKVVENNVDYLDFWFDLVNHLNLCKHYVKGLRESVIRQSLNATGTPLATNNPFNTGSEDNRESFPISDKSNRKSLSLSMLLDLIIKDHILEDDDSNRLSAFLRGDVNLKNVDPKLRQMIETYDSDESMTQPSPIVYNEPFLSNYEKRVSSQSRLVEDYDIGLRPPSMPRHSLTPSLVEKLIRETRASSEFISRETLRQLSHNLLLKYFVDDSEKSLNISPRLNRQVVHAIQVEGRDDPDVFNLVKKYVFSRLESDHLPNFLNFIAIKNVNRTTNSRVIVGFLLLFVSFWIAFSLIFLDQKKRYRCVILATFFGGFYSLVSSIYKIDPFLALCRRSESFIPHTLFIRVEDSFVRTLLLKRSAWVLFLVLLLTGALSVLFCLVPGKRL